MGKIELTKHGNEKTTIYKISDENGNLKVYAGLLVPHICMIKEKI